MAEAQRFRANVGIVVLNEKWEVLALERIDKDQLKVESREVQVSGRCHREASTKGRNPIMPGCANSVRRSMSTGTTSH